MSERARRRSSKWDFKEESTFSPEHVHIPQGEVQKTSTWDEGRGYGTRLSPSHGDWRRQRDRSPKEKWDNRSSRNRRSRSRSHSPGHGIRQESVRNERNRSRPGVPCKDFSLGRCRRGDDCPFVHQGTQNYEDSRETGARRGDISRNSNPRDYREQHTGRSSSDRDRRPPCKFFAAGNCRSGKSCRFSHTGGSESPERRLDEEKLMLGHNSDKASKSWEDPRFGGTSSVTGAVRFDDSRGSKRARHSRDNEWSPDGKPDPHFEPDKRKSVELLGDLAMSPDWNHESSTQVKDEIQSTDRSAAVTRNVENSLEKIGFSQNNMKEISLENPVFSQNNSKFSVNNWDGTNYNQQQYQSWDGIAPTTLNLVGQHNAASTVATASLTEKDLFTEGKSELYMRDSNTSEVIKNTVDGVQFPQLTDVSGSLAQLLGDGKQLPQLYAALNATGDALPLPLPLPLPEPQSLVDSTVSAAPLQKANSSDDMLGDTSSPVESKSIVNGAKGLISGDFQSSHADRPINGRTGEAAELSKNREESKGAGNNGHQENIGEEKKDEEKKGKETKATRAFKFALAEYVKELLKPSWKDGLVGKDDYKTIVKKVVDKVTDSFQGPNIPQTQEKIDNYLSLSKPKLTKLVQAYVEKFQKPK